MIVERPIAHTRPPVVWWFCGLCAQPFPFDEARNYVQIIPGIEEPVCAGCLAEHQEERDTN